MMTKHGFLIAAPQSGSGKTTISLAIMAALTRRGLMVAPFKCGPDFIDPGYHRAVTGSPSINLDSWMCGDDFVRETFSIHCEKASLAIIEGVMGLFDGIGSSSRTGSSAQIAALTGTPVVLVVNARGMAASAAPLVAGFAGFDPEVRVAGVIFNNIGSPHHGALLSEALAIHCPGIDCFGSIPRDESLAIPSRHLGLVTADDNPLPESFITGLADMAERYLDLDSLSRLAIEFPHTLLSKGEGKPDHPPVGIAVARDQAFCFIYEDNLRLLEETGGEMVFFSPLTDSQLPAGIQGIYLPGGYPELHGKRLSENKTMLESIRQAVDNGIPVYAECGGFIYLTQGIDGSEQEGGTDFTGIFPVRCTMLPRRKALGYRQIELTEDGITGSRGDTARGHEFHYSEISPMPADIRRDYTVTRQGVTLGSEGYRVRNCLASYIHLHFGSNRRFPRNFINACREVKGEWPYAPTKQTKQKNSPQQTKPST